MTGRRCLWIVVLAAVSGFESASTAVAQTTENAPGLVREGNYEPGNLGTVAQPAPQNDDASAVYGVGPWPTYTPSLADGEGKALVQGFCGACHSTTYITMQPPLPAATWEATVNKMIHMFGASIPEVSASQIIEYLKTHYTPETRKE